MDTHFIVLRDVDSPDAGGAVHNDPVMLVRLLPIEDAVLGVGRHRPMRDVLIGLLLAEEIVEENVVALGNTLESYGHSMVLPT